ncbi:MAG: hypothetical protein NDJ24_09565 [Alphaproteobacteria bacterium]|nr:hypothetical protein [Alphaproteobacteria bacterium]
MDFHARLLPRDVRIDRAIERLTAHYRTRHYPDPAALVQPVTATASVLAEMAPDNPPVPLICAAFLIHLPRDSYEYDNIRHDYGYDTFQAVKALASFTPLFEAPEYKSEVLKDPEVAPAVRQLHMAQSIAGIRGLSALVRQTPALHRDDVLRDAYEAHVLIAAGCRGASPLLDYLFEESITAFLALKTGRPAAVATAPSVRIPGPKPVLH